jgi:putative effector of murein hydrolase
VSLSVASRLWRLLYKKYITTPIAIQIANRTHVTDGMG